MSCSLCFVAFFKNVLVFCLSFIFSFVLHPSCIVPLLISSFLSLLPLDYFVYSWQKGRKYTKEYIGLYHHFNMTYVHTLKGSNSISFTFLGGESHRGDAYTRGRRHFFLRKPCFVFVLYYACFLIVLWCFELCLVSMLCCSHLIMLMCWKCIYLYAIVLYWLHVRIIICFVIWSL